MKGWIQEKGKFLLYLFKQCMFQFDLKSVWGLSREFRVGFDYVLGEELVK